MEIPTKGSCKWELIPLNFYFKPTLFLFHAMSWINIVRYAQGNARALNPPPRPSRAPPVWGDSPRMLSVAACGAGAPVALHVVHLYPYPPSRTCGDAASAGSPVVLGRPQGGSPPLDVSMSIYGPCLCFPRYRRFLWCGAK